MRVDTKARLTFPGGTHPPESKDLTRNREIQVGPAVKEVAIMLSQHTGAACSPVVGQGDAVKAGQKIGDSDAHISAPVHSPVDGRVKEIGLRPHAVLGRSPAIVIEVSDPSSVRHSSFELRADFNEGSYSPEQIRNSVRNAGIVGMGGGGFPTSVKLGADSKTPREVLIVNGCECEPYITCDYRIMLEWASRIIVGIKLAKRASGCPKVFMGIEDNKSEAINAMNAAVKATAGAEGIEVAPVRTKYPQGGERQLIKAILNKSVPSGGIPPMIGVVVLNVATVAAIAEVVVCGRPLTHRVVTVTGEAVAKPGNYYVPIGTLIEDLIGFCGGAAENAAKIIVGGPMMGIAIADLKTPITKTTGAITVLTEDQVVRKLERQQTPCIHCGRCLEVCPEQLVPTKIAHAVKNNLFDVAERYHIRACMECGCCSYVCPANIELAGYIKTGKIFLARQEKRMPA